ncbi:MAG: antitoxin [Candidatus Rokuibacteriota bacterium]|nr:MAG: antitoxin [Candidatus Rokubacteria bacterium]
MRQTISSDIVPRTTVNIDGPVLRDLKRLQKRERKPLGRLVSELLAQALGAQRRSEEPSRGFTWVSRPMHPLVDLDDKEAVQTILDRPRRTRH